MTILHLSDLHFGNDENEQQAIDARIIILNSLLAACADLPEEWRPDAVCITGDIAWRGIRTDYLKAEKWIKTLLQTLNLTSDNLFLCPGNHDVQRALITDRPTKSTAADALFSLPISEMDQLHTPFTEYSEFCKRLEIPKYKCGTSESYLVGVREFGGVTFLSQNSAWFASGHDHGQLWVGLPLLKHMAAQGQLEIHAPGKQTVIALMHHPMDWLNDAERHQRDLRQSTSQVLYRCTRILLTGHTHDTVTYPKLNEDHCWHFPAGAAFDSASHFNTFRLIKLKPPALHDISYEYDPRAVGNGWKQQIDKNNSRLLELSPAIWQSIVQDKHVSFNILASEPVIPPLVQHAGTLEIHETDLSSNSVETIIATELKRIGQLISTGQTRLAQGEISQLLLRAKTSSVPKTLLSKITNNLGICLLANEEFEKAVDTFEEANQYDPSNLTICVNLSLSQIHIGKIFEAEQNILKVLAIDDLNIGALTAWSAILKLKSEREKLLSLLAKIDKTEPTQALITLKAQIHHDLKNFDQAKKELESLELETLPSIIREFYARVLIDAVQEECERHGKLASHLPDAASKSLKKAISIITEILQEYSTFESKTAVIPLLNNRAAANMLLGEWNEALNDFDKIIAVEPTNKKILKGRLFAYTGSKKFEDAINLIADEEFTELTEALVQILIAEKLISKALNVISKQKHPSDQLRFQKARCELLISLEENNEQQATIQVGQIAQSFNTNPDALLLSADFYINHAQNTMAAALINDVIRIAQSSEFSPRLYDKSAALLMRIGRYGEAVQLIEGIDHQSNFSLRRTLTSAYFFAGRLDKALSLIESEFDNYNQDPYMLCLYGDLQEAIGALNDALKTFELAVSLEPDHAGYRLKLARLYSMFCHTTASKTVLDEIDIEGVLANPEYLLPLAFQYLCLGESQKALDLVYAAREKHFSDQDIHQSYIKIYLKLPYNQPSKTKNEIVEADSVVTFNTGTESQTVHITSTYNEDIEKGVISSRNPLAKILMGQRLGAVVTIKNTTFERVTAEITSIETKYSRAFSQSLQKYSTWFPENDDLQKVDFTDQSYVDELRAVESKTAELFSAYNSNLLTSNSLAQYLGSNLPQLWAEIITSEKNWNFSSSTDLDLRQQVAAIEKANNIVLDTSAALTCALLDLEHLVISSFKSVAIAGGTLSELEHAINLLNTEPLTQVPPNAPSAQLAEEKLRLLKKAQAFALQLNIISCRSVLTERYEKVADACGKSSAMTVAAVYEHKSTLYSDDLVFRKVLENEEGIPGFATQELLRHMTITNALTPENYTFKIAKLYEHGYKEVMIDVRDLVRATKASQNNPSKTFKALARIFSADYPLRDLIRSILDTMELLWFQSGMSFENADKFLNIMIRELRSRHSRGNIALGFRSQLPRFSQLGIVSGLIVRTIRQQIDNAEDKNN